MRTSLVCVSAGKLSRSSYVWVEGLISWVPLEELPDVFDVIRAPLPTPAVPPPVPIPSVIETPVVFDASPAPVAAPAAAVAVVPEIPEPECVPQALSTPARAARTCRTPSCVSSEHFIQSNGFCTMCNRSDRGSRVVASAAGGVQSSTAACGCSLPGVPKYLCRSHRNSRDVMDGLLGTEGQR
jgi:hypothetical protein